MKAFTDYLWFNTEKRTDVVNITEDLAARVEKSGVREGFCLVSAMHITAAIWVNDEEAGLKKDVMVWLEKLAPRGDYLHHQTGEDNADAHLKRTLVGHQALLPITRGPGVLHGVRRPTAQARGRQSDGGMTPVRPPARRFSVGNGTMRP